MKTGREVVKQPIREPACQTTAVVLLSDRKENIYQLGFLPHKTLLNTNQRESVPKPEVQGDRGCSCPVESAAVLVRRSRPHSALTLETGAKGHTDPAPFKLHYMEAIVNQSSSS